MKNSVQNLINELKELRGANVKIFGQPTTLRSDLDELEIDTVEVLENLREYECELIISNYDEELEDFDDEELEAENVDDAIQKFLDFMDETFGLKETKCDNTYNWNSSVSHHLQYHIFSCVQEGCVYVRLSAHKYGDVRGNYTYDVLLRFDDEHSFYETLNESNKTVEFTVDDKEFTAYIQINCENIEVCHAESGEYINTFYSSEIEELIEDVREYIK